MAVAKDMLTEGLRALEVLALAAPVGLSEFARRAALPAPTAAALMAVFEQGGYAVRVPHGVLYVLTPMAVDLVLAHNPIGTIVARAIEPVESCGRAIGCPVTLSIRRGAWTRRVIASEAHPDLAIGTPFRMLDTIEGQVFAAFGTNRRFGRADAIREAGYAMGTGHAGGKTIAVPLLVGRRPAAVLAAHIDGSGFDGLADVLPELHRVAQTLAGPMLEVAPFPTVSPPMLSASLH